MKNILLIIFMIPTLCFSQDIKLIESRVCELYKNYTKKKNINIELRTELDSLAFCQLRYLSLLENITQMSHKNNKEGYVTFDERVRNYYLYTSQSHFAEVLSAVNRTNKEYGDENKIAEDLFELLLSSPPHKKILDQKINKSYTFRVSKVQNGGFILIGILSGDDFFYLR